MTTTQNDPDAESAETHSMRRILEEAKALGDKDHVAVADILHAFGQASFMPLMILPGAALVSPLSGIPFFSSFCGLLIFLVAVQLLFRRSYVWLPGFVTRRRIRGSRLVSGLSRLDGIANWVDRQTRPRLDFLFHWPAIDVLRLALVCFGLLIPFLELLPFSSSLIGAGVVMTALGMLTRDGLIAGLAAVPFAVALGIVLGALFSLI